MKQMFHHALSGPPVLLVFCFFSLYRRARLPLRTLEDMAPLNEAKLMAKGIKIKVARGRKPIYQDMMDSIFSRMPGSPRHPWPAGKEHGRQQYLAKFATAPYSGREPATAQQSTGNWRENPGKLGLISECRACKRHSGPKARDRGSPFRSHHGQIPEAKSNEIDQARDATPG